MHRLLSSDRVFYSSLLLSALLILAIFCRLDDYSCSYFFSSDALYLPSIYKDLFTDNGSLTGWHFNPAPNFFPDMIVYFILMFFTSSNFLIATSLFSILQYVSILLLFRAIMTHITGIQNANRIALFANLTLALYFVDTVLNNTLILSFYLLINSYHTSAFLLALLCFLLHILYIKNGKSFNLVMIFIVCLLGVASDRLMIVTATCPLVIMSCFSYKLPLKRNRLWITGACTFTASALGLLLYYYLCTLESIHFDEANKLFAFANARNSVQLFLIDGLHLLGAFNVTALVFLLSVFSFVANIFSAAYFVIWKKEFTVLSLYIVFSSLFSVAVLLSPIINGNYTATDSFRYNVYAFYIGALNVPLFLHAFSKRLFNWTSASCIFVLTGFYLVVIGNNFSIKNYKTFYTYYPEKVKKIDAIAREKGLLKGVGDYWEAKYTTMFSRQNVRIYAVHSVLTKYYHVSNERWFNADTAIFNFVIGDKMYYAGAKTFFQFDTLTYLLRDPPVISVPAFKYTEASWSPQVLGSSVK